MSFPNRMEIMFKIASRDFKYNVGFVQTCRGPVPDPIRIISAQIYFHFKHPDWLFKGFQPISIH